MISIIRASEKDYKVIASIGMISVGEAHKDSSPAKDMEEYLKNNYNDISIKEELNDPRNVYHIFNYNEKPVGFSKIVLNAAHLNIAHRNVAKLDRIYLLKEFQDLKLGYELLKFNIEFSKKNNQSGIWLFTWIGNTKAVKFYLKAGFSIIASHMFKVSEIHSNENHQMLLDLWES